MFIGILIEYTLHSCFKSSKSVFIASECWAIKSLSGRMQINLFWQLFLKAMLICLFSFEDYKIFIF